MYKKALIMALFAALISTFAFADNLIKKEAVTYYNEGLHFQETGDFTKAIAAYNKTLITDPTYAKYIANNYGVMYARQGNTKAAEASFKEALVLDPGYRAAEINLGLLYERMGEALMARQIWDKAFKIQEMLDRLKPKDFMLEQQKEK